MRAITIIGGGLAGLSLGIALRRESVPVTIFEAARYPRHRVCGEFLSGRGAAILLEIANRELNFIEAREAKFCRRGSRTLAMKIEPSALCVSRYELDDFLAKKFAMLGGDLVVKRESTESSVGRVRATGRRRAETTAPRLLGLKAHARAQLSSDLEMHFGHGNYIGVCRLPGERVNVCGLFAAEQPMRNLHDEWRATLGAPLAGDSETVWDEDSFCSVTALTMDREADSGEFAIGDAAAMIPPLTGNGMSMAFESAEIAAPILTDYVRGTISWDYAIARHRKAWGRAFTARLKWAAFVQGMALSSSGQRILFLLGNSSPRLREIFFAKTRT